MALKTNQVHRNIGELSAVLEKDAGIYERRLRDTISAGVKKFSGISTGSESNIMPFN